MTQSDVPDGAQLWRDRGTGGPAELLSPVVVADTVLLRSRGLIGRGPAATPMYFPRTPAVHGAFLSRALDVALLDREGVVIVLAVLRPWRVVGPRRRAVSALEAAEGVFRAWGLAVGERLTVAGHAGETDD